MCAPHGHVMAGRAQHVPTATVEGVLVVAAAPAPAVLASRPYPTNEMCGVGVGKQNGGGMFKGGQGRATKSTRNERVSSCLLLDWRLFIAVPGSTYVFEIFFSGLVAVEL